MHGIRFIKKIDPRGSITLPSDVRDALEIRDGDFVEFEVISLMRKDKRLSNDQLTRVDLRLTESYDDAEPAQDADEDDMPMRQGGPAVADG